MDHTSDSNQMTDPEDTSVLAGPSNTLSSHPTEDAAPAMGIVAARFITSSELDLVRLTSEELTTCSSKSATPRLPW